MTLRPSELVVYQGEDEMMVHSYYTILSIMWFIHTTHTYTIH